IESFHVGLKVVNQSRVESGVKLGSSDGDEILCALFHSNMETYIQLNGLDVIDLWQFGTIGNISGGFECKWIGYK
ncbi:hypothetical protein U1Q18_022810, partial [Sarracenia purpurea var. burkii]